MPELLQRLENKTITKNEINRKIEENFDLLPELLGGLSSPKPAVRYGCAGILMDLSEKYPEKLYPYMDSFTALLDSKYRILVWNALATIANLAKVDKNKKFDAIFDKYYSFLNDEYMVTVANVVANSSKIALAKPSLIPKITKKLLKVEDLATTPHLTDECRLVIAEKTIKSFGAFYDKIQDKDKVKSFVKKYVNSPRKSLKKEASDFVKKHA